MSLTAAHPFAPLWIGDVETWKGYSVKGHRYRITVEHLATPRGENPNRPPLSFEAVNHDDIQSIVERVRGNGLFEPDEAAAMAVGLKLFTEVMLKHRSEPLFADLAPAMRDFIGRLKAQNSAASQ